MNCNQCGEPIQEKDKFCISCGKPIEKNIVDLKVEPEVAKEKKESVREKPMSVFAFMVTVLVLLIPIVGVIMTFIWSFSSKTNINRQNYARTILILGIVGLLILIGIGIFVQSSLLPFTEGFGI